MTPAILAALLAASAHLVNPSCPKSATSCIGSTEVERDKIPSTLTITGSVAASPVDTPTLKPGLQRVVAGSVNDFLPEGYDPVHHVSDTIGYWLDRRLELCRIVSLANPPGCAHKQAEIIDTVWVIRKYPGHKKNP